MVLIVGGEIDVEVLVVLVVEVVVVISIKSSSDSMDLSIKYKADTKAIKASNRSIIVRNDPAIKCLDLILLFFFPGFLTLDSLLTPDYRVLLYLY